MVYRDPAWIKWLEKRIPFIALENMALYLIVLQVFGFLVVQLNPTAFGQLTLNPVMILQGEVWRLFTFLAIPMSGNIFFMLIFLYMLYFFVNSLESQWGAFKVTLYLLIATLFTILFSFLFNYEVTTFWHIETSLFLAVAMMFPNLELLLFFIIPVKMVYLAILTAVYILYMFIFEARDNLDRLYFFFVYLNYILFFGLHHYEQVRSWMRRSDYLRRTKK